MVVYAGVVSEMYFIRLVGAYMFAMYAFSVGHTISGKRIWYRNRLSVVNRKHSIREFHENFKIRRKSLKRKNFTC